MEFALEYKVKQSKNSKFPSHYKLAQSILKHKFPSMHKPHSLFLEFYSMFIKKISNILPMFSSLKLKEGHKQ